jgi:hypothetical protein
MKSFFNKIGLNEKNYFPLYFNIFLKSLNKDEILEKLCELKITFNLVSNTICGGLDANFFYFDSDDVTSLIIIKNDYAREYQLHFEESNYIDPKYPT